MGKKKSNDHLHDYIAEVNDRQFFRAYKSLIESDAFSSLTPGAQMLYIRMGLSSNGQREFTFPYSKYRKHYSKEGFNKAKNQLIEKGFISETRYRTAANIYKLEWEWKTFSTVYKTGKTSL